MTDRYLSDKWVSVWLPSSLGHTLSRPEIDVDGGATVRGAAARGDSLALPPARIDTSRPGHPFAPGT